MSRVRGWRLANRAAYFASLASVLLIAAPALAEEAEPAGTLEEVIVTAQKRAEALEDVPIAISAFSGQSMERMRLRSIEDVASLAPSTNYKNQSPAAPSISIRGITSDESGAGSESAVSTYLDGVDISRREGAQMAIYDMDRIEIVRGPQGTLFGTASQIGGLSLITRKPQMEFAGYLNGAVGNLDYRRIEGAVNVPISDVAAFRIAGFHEERTGYIKNRAATGGDADDYMGQDTTAARGSFKYEPTDQLSVTLVGYFQDDNPTGTQFTSLTIPTPSGGHADYFKETYQAPRKPSKFSRNVYGGTLLIEAELNDKVSFSSITGYREYDYQQYFDLDGGFVAFVDSDINNKTSSLYQEARVNFTAGERLQGFAGLSYIRETVDETIGLTFSEPIFGILSSGVFVLPNGQPNQLVLPPSMGITLDPNRREYREQGGRKTDISAFVDVTYDFTDRLKANGGVRFVRNERRFISNQPAVGQAGLIKLGVYSSVSTAVAAKFKALDPTFSATNPSHALFSAYYGALQAALPGAYAAAPKNLMFAATNGAMSGSDSFDGVLPRFSVQYELSNGLHAYVGVAKGQRSGFLEADRKGGVSSVDPEQLWNYEVGLKGAYAHFRFDTALFHYTWKDFQTVELIDPSNPTLGQRSVNAGSASATGFEFAGAYLITDGVDLFANFSYLDGGFDDFKSSEGDFSGNRFRISPEYQAAIGLNAERPISGNLSAFFSGRVRYQSKVYFDNENVAPKMDDGHIFVSGNLGIRDQAAGWSARLFADNLLNEKYLLDAGNSGENFGTPTMIAGAPRTFGIEFGLEF
ncbi:MAG: TonB-dependent receptor [Pseudomonadota bacterium]|uniref:TonB-dependent receptor n=1 Tax=Phenylobacterium sp. TaxID=1871053 RepID=UPI0025DEDE51|nr:TonB-dependent receptor [Phenylobacterium sp.]MBT9470435.1 TonB-dependent receptor [Phenylobacterium sp.]